jgi:hypothetical protein
MQFRLEPMNGSPGYPGMPLDVVYTYNVCGLPEGHGAYIQNLGYPDNLWSIWRIRNGIPEPNPTGNYLSAEVALAVLQDEYK